MCGHHMNSHIGGEVCIYGNKRVCECVRYQQAGSRNDVNPNRDVLRKYNVSLSGPKFGDSKKELIDYIADRWKDDG